MSSEASRTKDLSVDEIRVALSYMEKQSSSSSAGVQSTAAPSAASSEEAMGAEIQALGESIKAAKQAGKPKSEWNSILQNMLAMKAKFKESFGKDFVGVPSKNSNQQQAPPQGGEGKKKKKGKGGGNANNSQGKQPAAPARPWTDELQTDYERILTVGEECISPEELKTLLTMKGRGSETAGFNLYDGFEPSGRMHIAQGVFKAMNVNKCTMEGTNGTFVFWVADWFALMNDKSA